MNRNSAFPNFSDEDSTDKPSQSTYQHTLRVASIQLISRNGQNRENLTHAGLFVEKAVQKGARLILLPELMSTGYLFTNEIWDYAETKYGPTFEWLRRLSYKYGVWIGTSFMEVEKSHFYNTFMLTGPDGEEAGSVRKQTPCWCESHYYKGDPGSHVINTPIGKIGVSICFESLRAHLLSTLYKESPDILLMPHSASMLMYGGFVKMRHIKAYYETLWQTPLLYANQLGIPVIMANKCGSWHSPIPFGKNQDSYFPGLSRIIDGDATVLARLGQEEGVIVSEVTLNPAMKKHDKPTYYGHWAWKGKPSRNLIRIREAFGSLTYNLSLLRRRKARKFNEY